MKNIIKPVKLERNKLRNDSYLISKFPENERNNENYSLKMIELEMKIENELIEILHKIGIEASVKSNRYSLPIHYQLSSVNVPCSFTNFVFGTKLFFKNIIKELLIKNVNKIRFYVFSEVADNPKEGDVNHYFRYFVHY